MASISLTVHTRWYFLKKKVLFNILRYHLKHTLHYNIKYLLILKVGVDTC